LRGVSPGLYISDSDPLTSNTGVLHNPHSACLITVTMQSSQ
jgi:hypothetical protein